MSTKKYISLDKLSLYDEKIKGVISAGDAAALQSAKDYADSLATNYDAAGAANTALTNAKAYTDEQIVAVNTTVAGVKTTAEKGVSDAAAAAGAAAAAQTAADNAQAAADAAQGEVDALETYVGTFTHDTAKSVVEYINAKTDGIATSGNLEALAGRVTAAEGAIDAIEADYLKAADKTELSDAITAEASRADAAEKANAAAIKVISDDYLKAADKTELQGNIDAVAEDVAEIAEDYLKAADKTELNNAIALKADQTALAQEVTDRTNAVAGLQTQINTIMNNPDAEGAINSINEFTQYVAEHGTIADGMRTDINANAKAIEDEAKAARAAEGALSGRLDTLEAINHEAYVAADTALKNELNAEIAKKANASDVEAAVGTLEAADEALSGRLDDVEAALGTGEGSVADQIADAKQEAIDAAAADATTKAGNAETNAKTYADGLNTAMNTRVEALEAVDHEHSNKALLDTYTQTEANLADAVAKKHEHANKTVLDGITAEKVSAWDAAEANAKTYADGLNTAMTTKVDAIGERVTVNEGSITTINTELAKKALQTDLEAVSGRVTTLETWHNNFTEVSEEEINNLFA